MEEYENNYGCGLPDPGMIASRDGMCARDSWEMEQPRRHKSPERTGEIMTTNDRELIKELEQWCTKSITDARHHACVEAALDEIDELKRMLMNAGEAVLSQTAEIAELQKRCKCQECSGSGTVVRVYGQGEHGDCEQEACGDCNGTGLSCSWQAATIEELQKELCGYQLGAIGQEFVEGMEEIYSSTDWHARYINLHKLIDAKDISIAAQAAEIVKLRSIVNGMTFPVCETCAEQAKEIERLKADDDKLWERLNFAESELSKKRATCNQLQAELAELRRRV